MTEGDAATSAARERGRLIGDAIKRLPIEQRFRCQNDYRMVAAIVWFKGERCLWIAGGVDERERMLVAEADAAAVERPHWPAWGDFWRRKATERRAVGGEMHHRWAEALPPPKGNRIELQAPCPRCHRSVTLVADDDGSVAATRADPMR